MDYYTGLSSISNQLHTVDYYLGVGISQLSSIRKNIMAKNIPLFVFWKKIIVVWLNEYKSAQIWGEKFIIFFIVIIIIFVYSSHKGKHTKIPSAHICSVRNMNLLSQKFFSGCPQKFFSCQKAASIWSTYLWSIKWRECSTFQTIIGCAV